MLLSRCCAACGCAGDVLCHGCRFSLASDTTILVSEIESTQPGFPPLSTVVAFWTAERKHYHWRIFKPLHEVAEDDLPPAWYKEALEVDAGVQCSCC